MEEYTYATAWILSVRLFSRITVAYVLSVTDHAVFLAMARYFLWSVIVILVLVTILLFFSDIFTCV